MQRLEWESPKGCATGTFGPGKPESMDERTPCPGCGVTGPSTEGPPDPSLDATAACLHHFHELSGYTLTAGHPRFIHQHIVDAYAAQHAGLRTKPIRVCFALIGLYLLVEEKFTGRQIQLVHLHFARQTKFWPKLARPPGLASMNVVDVLRQPPGPDRDDAIERWSKAVWNHWSETHETVGDLYRRYR